MTPAARYAAAAEVVDAIRAGQRVEPALRNWGRSHRFAGSKDRRAIADIVYEIARKWWSTAALGGAETGRGRVLGLLRSNDLAPETVFTGGGHALSALEPDERAHDAVSVPYDIPPFLVPQFEAEYGDALPALNVALQGRAPVDIRANLLKTDVETLQQALSADGFEAHPVADVPAALRIEGDGRGLKRTALFEQGHFELQDAGSQRIVDFAEPKRGERVLDFCAGGGGKTLALAAATGGPVVAHDIAPQRMVDLPGRAARAGAQVEIASPQQLDGRLFDLVFVDAPCSGSGAWRRDPGGKIALTQERFASLLDAQTDALETAARFVAPGGRLAYATCSLISHENYEKIEAYLNRYNASVPKKDLYLNSLVESDGFYCRLIGF